MRGALPSSLAALMTAIALLFLAGYQVTSETAGVRLLGRLADALVEIDRWLPRHREDLQLLGHDRPQGVVRVGDLPIAVTLPAPQVVEADEVALRGLVHAAMGQALYEQGNAAFRDQRGVARKPSLNDPVRWTVSLLGSGAHGFWEAALLLSLLLLLAVVAGVLLAGRSPLTPLAFGAGLGAAASLATWLLSAAASGALDNPVDKEIALILRDGSWIGLRDSLAVGVTAVTLIFLVTTLGRERARSRLSPAPTQPPDAPPV